jgi:hypothetical protein
LASSALELHEFADLVARGAGPSRSAFLSAFFTLVGCHGLHVSAGLLWLLTMMAQVFAKGFRADIQRRILCFACSGTRSTSSGSRCSRSSICSGAAHERHVHHPHDPAIAPRRRGRRRRGVARALLGYLIGLALAILLTATSFFVAGTDLVWQPSIPVASSCWRSRRWACIWCSSCTSPPGRQHQQRAGAGLRRADRGSW